MIFYTDPRNYKRIVSIATKMVVCGAISSNFVRYASLAACRYEGMFDLFCLWDEEDTTEERNAILKDIQDELNNSLADDPKWIYEVDFLTLGRSLADADRGISEFYYALPDEDQLKEIIRGITVV